MASEQSEKQKNKLDPELLATIRAGLWPFVAVLLIIFLIQPVRKVVDRLPDVLGQAEEISLGGVKLKFANLPRPSTEVAKAITQLHPADFWALSRIPEQIDCIPLESGNRQLVPLMSRLERAGLLEQPRQNPSGVTESGSCYKLSDTAVNVLTWAIELVGAQVKN